MGKNVIIGLAAVVVALALGAAAFIERDVIAGLLGLRKHEAPTLMIVSSNVLKQTAESMKAEAEHGGSAASTDALAAALELSFRAKPPPSKDGATPPIATTQTAATPAKQQRDAERKTATGLQLLVESMEDSLGGRVSQVFQDSNRFRLVASSRVVDAMNEYAAANKLSLGDIMQVAHGKFFASTKSNGVESASRSETTTTTLTYGLTKVGAKVGADFILVVTIGEPNLTIEGVDAVGAEPAKVVMMSQPILNCEVFRTNGRLAYRFNKQLDRPIVETVVGYAGIPAKGVLLAKYNRMNDRIAAAASQQMLAWTLDKIAPARVVRAEDKQFVINRGSNDGVANGAVYDVMREVGETIREGDDGVDLGRERVKEGSIVIQSVQERISVAAVATGGPFLKDDIVLVASSAKPDTASAAAKPAGPTPLNVAVDNIALIQGGKPADASEPLQIVSGVLAEDARVTVLPRAELGNLAKERALNEQAGGDYTVSPTEGMRQSSYLVDGECRVESHRRSNSIDLGGVSRTVSSSVSTTVRCELRATSVDGRLMGSVQADGPSVADAAKAAARAMLAKLLSATGAAPPQAPVAASVADPAPSAVHRARPKSAAASEAADQGGVHF